MAESLVLGLALEDALSDLVQIRGIGYLDTFFERRMRRTVEAMRTMPTGVPDLMKQMGDQQAESAEAALRHVIENVRRDPNPVT
jgi:hypothetical protein